MRFDLHIHSNYSIDSSLSIDDILRQAAKKGLDGVAICDHNTVEGSIRGKERAGELGLHLIVIAGTEVSTTKGHMLVLGVKESIPSNLSPEETIRIARQKGGVIIAAHPFKKNSKGMQWDVDAIETFNSRCIFGENAKAKKLAQSSGIPEVGGSDSHLLATIGMGFTDIDAEPDEGAVLKAIKEGRTTSSGKVIPLYLVFILFLRSLFRKLRRFVVKVHSKIFHRHGTM